MNEQFSAFLDGEASRGETDAVVHALLSDESQRRAFSRQHWLRTTLRAHRDEPALALDAGFSDRVMQAIADEDRPAAPARAPVAARMRRRWRHVAGAAAVASAAGVVLLVSNGIQQSGPQPGGPTIAASSANAADAPAASVAAAGPAGGIEVASLTDVTSAAGAAKPRAAAVDSADHWSVSDPDLANELNGYLAEHSGLAQSYGLSSTTPAYVRVATYGEDGPR